MDKGGKMSEWRVQKSCLQYVSWMTVCEELKINDGGGGKWWLELEESIKD